MNQKTRSTFEAVILRPAQQGADAAWGFIILPKDASAKLPRRGRTTAHVILNGCGFQAMLEPDGQRSHWLKLDQALLHAAGARIGDTASFEIAAVKKEPEPELPADFEHALAANGKARTVWGATTTLARVDWIHWIESAKQAKTRANRIEDACDMLASGKKRVCCFDPSGFYSKALSAPKADV